MRWPFAASASIAAAILVAMACGEPIALGPSIEVGTPTDDGGGSSSSSGSVDATPAPTDGCSARICADTTALVCDDFERKGIDAGGWVPSPNAPELIEGPCGTRLHAHHGPTTAMVDQTIVHPLPLAPYGDVTFEADLTFSFDQASYTDPEYTAAITFATNDWVFGFGVASLGPAVQVQQPPVVTVVRVLLAPDGGVGAGVRSGVPVHVKARLKHPPNGVVQVWIGGERVYDAPFGGDAAALPPSTAELRVGLLSLPTVGAATIDVENIVVR